MRRLLVIALALFTTVALAGIAVGKPKSGFTTSVKRYAVGLNGWETKPIISVGDTVPETRNPGAKYRMVGIPDGLGLDRRAQRVRVLMTHEFVKDVESEPLVGRPAHRGAFASEFILNKRGEVLSARRAYERVYQDSTLVGDTADTSNSTPSFARFCSAFLADYRVGFDRPVFFANEEQQPVTGGTPSFDPKGSQSVAIFNREAHALSKLGHFPKENTLVMRGTGKRTVILSTEDGPRTPDSQLYLYVGRKDRSSRDPLRRNGLDNGKLYVFAVAGMANENELLQGDTVHGSWREIPNADELTDAETEAKADELGAFGFVRLEDGEFRPNAKREFWFDSTGDQGAADEADPHINELGRLYRLRFDKANPLAGARLTQAYNADQLTAEQDGPLSPDNLTVGKRFVAINEDGTAGSASDGTTGSRDDMDRRGRDGSIWLVPIASPGNPATFRRVAELVGRSEGGRDGILTVDERGNRAGVWETSGIIDSRLGFGRGTFLFDVQAHSPTTAPDGASVTVEDGQLLMLRRAG